MQLDIDEVLCETFIARAEYHPCIGSTNDRAIACASQRDGELPLLVVADRQIAGRGRGSNHWWSGSGALMFSLLVDAKMVGADCGPTPLIGLAVGVAVVDAIAPRLPAHQVGIHWPNDVFAMERKLAGILIEALPDRRHVIGIGVNTNNTLADAPPELQATAATLLGLAGNPIDQTDFLVDLLKHLERQFAQLRCEPEQVARRADMLCLQQGRMLTLRCGDRTITGRCKGVATDGAIRLETSTGVKHFYSGTLSLPE